jgi:hypothetical protein
VQHRLQRLIGWRGHLERVGKSEQDKRFSLLQSVLTVALWAA